MLTTKIPLFKKLLSTTPNPTPEQLTFDDLNEFAAALLIRWLYGGKLHGPSDFHSLQHYLCLYVMGQKWDSEALCNDSKHMLVKMKGRSAHTLQPSIWCVHTTTSTT